MKLGLSLTLLVVFCTGQNPPLHPRNADEDQGVNQTTTPSNEIERLIYARQEAGNLTMGTDQAVTQATNAGDEIERLIDALQEVGDPTTGANPLACSIQFMALNEEPEMMGGIIGSPKPLVDPTMRELVQLGVKAIPQLISHLKDTRASKLVLKHDGGFGGMWLSNEYSPRYIDPELRPKGLDELMRAMDNSVSEYTIRVGDLCYIAIGQIVNRGLNVARYQPTACTVINSPLSVLALADAVKQDWHGLTEAEHKKQLEQDCYSIDQYFASGALVRLLYYYPEDGKRVALRLVGRKLYNVDSVWEVFEKKLLRTDRKAEWRAIIDEASRKFGPQTIEALPALMRYHMFEWPADYSATTKARTERILSTYFPNFCGYANRFVDAVGPEAQEVIIESLAPFEDIEIDEAIQNAYEQSKEFDSDLTSDMTARDLLVLACLDRMISKGRGEEYREFLTRRIAVWKTDTTYAHDYMPEVLAEALARIDGVRSTPAGNCQRR